MKGNPGNHKSNRVEGAAEVAAAQLHTPPEGSTAHMMAANKSKADMECLACDHSLSFGPLSWSTQPVNLLSLPKVSAYTAGPPITKA